MGISKVLKNTALKAEALTRMYLMELDSKAIISFRDFGQVMVSDSSSGTIRELNDIEEDLIRSIEHYGNCLVYHKLRHYDGKKHFTDYYLFVDDICCRVEKIAASNKSPKATAFIGEKPNFGLAIKTRPIKSASIVVNLSNKSDPNWQKDKEHIREGIVSACTIEPETGKINMESDFVYGTTKEGVLEFIV